MSVPTIATSAHLRNQRPVYDMVLPFDPNTIRSSAEARGMTRDEAARFAQLALEKVREIYARTQAPVTAEVFSREMMEYARKEMEKCKREMEDKAKGEAEQGLFGQSVANAMELDLQASEHARAKKHVMIEEAEEDGARRKRFKFSPGFLQQFFQGRDPYGLATGLQDLDLNAQDPEHSHYKGRDILSILCQNIEIATNIGRYLDAKDILSLYSTSKVFHNTVNSHLMSTIRTWVNDRCPEAGKVFSHQLYKRHLVLDPLERTWAQQYNIPGASATVDTVTNLPSPAGSTSSEGSPTSTKTLPPYSQDLHQVRPVPGLKYLQLVTNRHRFCSEILAILARYGHRTPPSTHGTLLRLWLLLEIPTSTLRQSYLRNTALWTDIHLYNAQLLFLKLGMHFNDPIYGPNTYELLHLMLGQKGLYPLWQLLLRKRFTRLAEILELRVRYDFQIPPDHWGGNYFDRTVHNVPFHEIGTYHLEGWGRGTLHLMRPDELIPIEAVTRGLELDKHLMHMITWGYIDWKTGENLVPTEEEMHIDNSDQVLQHMDTRRQWKKRHVLKKRFDTLTSEQQQEIRDYDEDERLRAMGWCGDNIDDYDSPYASESGNSDHETSSHVSLDEEIDRGYILRTPPPPGAQNQPPSEDCTLENLQAWRNFSNSVLIGLPPSLSEDESLRALPYHSGTDAVWELEEQERREALRRRVPTAGAPGGQGEGLFVEGIAQQEEPRPDEDLGDVAEEDLLANADGQILDFDLQALPNPATDPTVQHVPFAVARAQIHDLMSAGLASDAEGPRASTILRNSPTPPPSQPSSHLATTPPSSATPPRRSGFTPVNVSPASSHTRSENQAPTGREPAVIPVPQCTWSGSQNHDDGYDSEASTVRMVEYGD